jgi:uncharacterized protein
MVSSFTSFISNVQNYQHGLLNSSLNALPEHDNFTKKNRQPLMKARRMLPPLIYSDDDIRLVLKSSARIAILGASDNPARPSFGVFQDLQARGYTLFPVNPARLGREVLGVPFVASLSDLPGPVDLVDIFRSEDALEESVEEILAMSPLPKVIWMQLGLRHDGAARKAEAAGIQVIMDRCPSIELRRVLKQFQRKWEPVSRSELR